MRAIQHKAWPNAQQHGQIRSRSEGNRRIWWNGKFRGLGVNNNDFRIQLHHCTHHVIHLEKVPGPLWASVWQSWMCTAQITLKEKTSFEECDQPTPSCCILAKTTLFLGCSQTATEHSRVQSRDCLPDTGLLSWARDALGPLLSGHHSQSGTGAWGFSYTFRPPPLSSFSGVRPTSHSAETAAYSCSFSPFTSQEFPP